MPLPNEIENLVLEYIKLENTKSDLSNEVTPEAYFLHVFIMLSLLATTGIYYKEPSTPLIALMAGFSGSMAVLIKSMKISYNTVEVCLKTNEESRNWQTARFFINFDVIEEKAKTKMLDFKPVDDTKNRSFLKNIEESRKLETFKI